VWLWVEVLWWWAFGGCEQQQSTKNVSAGPCHQVSCRSSSSLATRAELEEVLICKVSAVGAVVTECGCSFKQHRKHAPIYLDRWLPSTVQWQAALQGAKWPCPPSWNTSTETEILLLRLRALTIKIRRCAESSHARSKLRRLDMFDTRNGRKPRLSFACTHVLSSAINSADSIRAQQRAVLKKPNVKSYVISLKYIGWASPYTY